MKKILKEGLLALAAVLVFMLGGVKAQAEEQAEEPDETVTLDTGEVFEYYSSGKLTYYLPEDADGDYASNGIVQNFITLLEDTSIYSHLFEVTSVELSGNILGLEGTLDNRGENAETIFQRLNSVTVNSTQDYINIGIDAFCSQTVLEEVSVNVPVGSIGEEAFANCDSLTSFVLDSGVSIGAHAFSYSGLTSITIRGVENWNIDQYAFSDCAATTIEVSEDLDLFDYTLISNNFPNVTTIKGCVGSCARVLAAELTEMLDYDVSYVESNCEDYADHHICGFNAKYTLNEGTLTVEPVYEGVAAKIESNGKKSPFITYNGKIFYVVLEDGITDVEAYTFYDLQDIRTLTIKGENVNIGKQAFDGDMCLTTVEISGSVATVGWGSFQECYDLKTIAFPEGLTSIGQYAFCECTNLTCVELPDSLTTIGSNAFTTWDEESEGYATIDNVYFVTTSTTAISYAESNNIPYSSTHNNNLTVSKAGYAATYESTGLTDTYSCACGKVVIAAEVIPKLELKTQTVTATRTYKKTYGNAAFTLDAVTNGDGSLVYSSGNTAVVKVSSKGKVTITGAGNAVITVYAKASDTYAQSKSVSINITVAKGTSTVTLSAKSTAYTGKAISVKAAKVTGSTGAVTYTYYTDKNLKNKTTKKANGSASSGAAPKYPGIYYVVAKVAADSNYKAATSSTVKLTITKATPTITVGTTAKSYKLSTVKKAARTFSIGAKVTGNNKLTYVKSSGSRYLTVNKTTGKVTVKKGTLAGTYSIKIKITAASGTYYKSGSGTFIVKVTVK